MVEWLRTLFVLVAERQALGESWDRLAMILGLVAVITGGSALFFSYSSSVRQRYGLEGVPKEEKSEVE